MPNGEKNARRSVLHLTDYGAPYEGNFIASLRALEAVLAARGRDMLYVFPPRARKSDWARRMQAEHDNVFFSPEKGFFAYARALRRLLRMHSVDIVHVHFIHYREKLAALWACATCGHRVATVCHLHNHLVIPNSFVRSLPQRFYIAMVRRFLCASRSVAAHLLADGAPQSKVVVTENAIAFARLDAGGPLHRAALSLPSHAKIVMMFGYNYHVKGVDLAVEAVRRLREDGRDVVLAIVLASRREEVARAIRGQLDVSELPAWIVLLPPRADVGAYYRLADVFVSPSRQEGFCYALVEAAYCETPVAASAIDAQRDLALPPDSFFAPEDAQSLADKLGERLLAGRDAAALAAAKRRVVESYSLDVWAAAVADAYASLPLSARRAKREDC